MPPLIPMPHGDFPPPAPGTTEEYAQDDLNAETRELLARIEAGTEPLYGPFATVDAMFAALDAMPDDE